MDTPLNHAPLPPARPAAAVRRFRAAIGGLICLFGIWLVTPGCQSSGLFDLGGSGDPAAPSSLWADWDDVDAAMMVGLSESETAVLQSTSTDAKREFELLSIDGRKGMLTITRDPAAGRNPKGSEKLAITATVEGPNGPDQARRAKRGVMQRLEDLAGVDYAPVR